MTNVVFRVFSRAIQLRHPVAALAPLLFVANFAATAGDLETKLKYCRNIAPCDKPGMLAAVHLDKTIYEKIGDFSDIRVIGSSKGEVPFRVRLLRKSKNKIIKILCASKVVSLKRLPDNQIEIVLKNLDVKHHPVSLAIRTPNRNYDKKISISTAATPNGEWRLSSEDHSIFDYSAIIALSNTSVPLPVNAKCKFFKITIANFSELKQSKRMRLISERRGGKEFSEIKNVMRFNDDFKIDRIILTAVETIVMKKAPLVEEAESAILANSVKKHDTVVVIETFNQPIIRMDVTTSSVNFSRKLSVYSSDDKKNWNRVCDGSITKISVGACRKSSMKIHFSETRSKFLKLLIHNQDAPPIDVTEVKCSRNAYAAEFIIEGDTSLKMYYDGDLSVPRYDIDAILANLKNPVPLFLKLGPEQSNPAYSPSPAKPFWNSTLLMYILIGVVVVFLVGMLFSGMKKIDDEPA